MTKKADFNAEDWSALVEGPLMAGMRVIAAERGGTIRESLAMGKLYAQARQAHGQSELLDDLVSSPPQLDPQRVASGGDVKTVATERLREATRIIEQNASAEEAEAYKRFVLSVAEAAAGAHKEGGVLGIGGKPISDSEQLALDEIASTLQLQSGRSP